MQHVVEQPDFGQKKVSSSEFEVQTRELGEEFDRVRYELSEDRRRRNDEFYKELHSLTYSDFRKHESPTRRLIKQKDETWAHK